MYYYFLSVEYLNVADTARPITCSTTPKRQIYSHYTFHIGTTHAGPKPSSKIFVVKSAIGMYTTAMHD